MRLTRKRSLKKATIKILLAGVLAFGVSVAFAQTLPPPPPAPPSPTKLWKKINPFKKGKLKLPPKPKLKTPPPPPNPVDVVKKVKLPKPPPPPGG